MTKKSLSIRALGLAVLALATTSSYASGSMTGQYYSLSENHIDANENIDGVVTGLVQNNLDPMTGLPIAVNTGTSMDSAVIKDVNASNDILWWTPGTRTVLGTTFSVTSLGSEVDALPLNQPSNLWAAGESNDSNKFLAVHWSGTFNLAAAQTLSMNLGSDDDAWVFINGQLAIDNGGVHALSTQNYTTSMLSAGNYNLDLFFIDRHNVQSGITFDPGVQVNAVPEPSSYAVLGLGLLGLVSRRRRKA